MASIEFLNLDLVLKLNQAKGKTEEVIKDCKSFKIGKTGQDLIERFRSGYEDKYKRIKQLASSSNPEVVSYIEAELIQLYKDHDRCDNERDGLASFNDEMRTGATEYHVYIVWK